MQAEFDPDSPIIMSADIAWAITRNTSAYLLKKRGAPKPFNTDPLNLTGRNALRYNGSLHKKAVAVLPAADNKGVVLALKKPVRANRPRVSLNKTNQKSGAR